MKPPLHSTILVAGLLALTAAGVWMIVDRPAPAVAAPARPARVVATPAPAEFSPGTAVAMPAPPLPPDLPLPKQHVVVSPEAVKEIEDVQFMLRDFRARLGGNPGGTNAEIVKSLNGENSAHLALGPRQGQRLNETGELLDRWDVPYFFHQLSSTEMEVRSAGPDRTLYTSDDIVLK
jgi:hypothetical protein